ncbi:hypothetical protein [Cellulomonas sp. URHB0016]
MSTTVDAPPGSPLGTPAGPWAVSVSRATPTWRDWTPGERVVVRRRRDDVPADGTPANAGGEPRYTDVLGEVLAVADDGVLVRTRKGDVHVPATAITLAKTVPPAPQRRARSGSPVDPDGA